MPHNMKIGQRVRLRRDVERFPEGIVPAGSTGIVVRSNFEFAVDLDLPLEWLQEWDNCLIWDGPEHGDPAEDLEVMP